MKQGRRHDVAYLTAELLEQFGEAAALPQSLLLIGEIASPTDTKDLENHIGAIWYFIHHYNASLLV